MEGRIILLTITILGTLQEATSFDCSGKNGFYCDPDDCSIMQVCIGSATPFNAVKCTEMSKDKPFCFDNECSALPDPQHKCSINVPFVCGSIGVFPDPNDCTIFHQCTDINKPSIVTRCPPTYTYVSSLKTCKRTAECQKVDCSAKANQNKYIVNRNDPAYYAYCFAAENGTKLTVMQKCDDEINYIYDPASNECVFNCKSETNYVDRSDCHSYISCFRINGKYQATSTKCPLNYYFDKTAGRCAPETNPPCLNEISDSKDAPNPENSSDKDENGEVDENE